MSQRINCLQCEYYFVTWQPGQPHGCKAYGFKSKLHPSIAVRHSSGQACQMFSPKQKSMK